MTRLRAARDAYRLRWRRRMLRFRGLRKFNQLTALRDRTSAIGREDILLFVTIRNEMVRLPFFLDHYRQLGVSHFLVVDNGSTDETTDFLTSQPDVSLWSAPGSYRRSRFGMDWLTCLQFRYGAGHWCLTVDADEILIYPYHTTRPLPALVAWLEAHDLSSFGALMLDMYPNRSLGYMSSISSAGLTVEITTCGARRISIIFGSRAGRARGAFSRQSHGARRRWARSRW